MRFPSESAGNVHWTDHARLKRSGGLLPKANLSLRIVPDETRRQVRIDVSFVVMNHMRCWGRALLFGTAGAVFRGGFMGCGTLVLGHARPMWMEFEYAPRWAFYGFVAGGIIGSIVTWLARASNSGAEPPETYDQH